MICVITNTTSGPRTDTINRQLKSGIGNQALAELVTVLRADARLCRVSETTESTEPQVICPMGLRAVQE